MKYKLTDKYVRTADGTKVYQIQRISNGELGGYIAHERNLSQDGSCWVYGNARVYGNACVSGNARVYKSLKATDKTRTWNGLTNKKDRYV